MNGNIKITITAVLLAMALPATGHHSFYAEFDSSKEIRLEGKVVRMEWVNPHSWLNVEVVNDQGESEVWKVEGGSPGVLLRLGWTRDSFPPGTEVIVNGFGAKDGSLRMSSRGIEFPDGRVMETGGSQPMP